MEMPFLPRFIVTNSWLFGPLLTWRLSQNPILAASLRTTTAVTVIQSGGKDNVIPMRANATVNFRICPTDTTSSVLLQIQEIINDKRIKVVKRLETAIEPSPETPDNSPSFRLLQRTIAQVFPEAIAAPSVMIGSTDTRHYWSLTDCIYRFNPVIFDAEDLARVHGINERISIESHARVAKFYANLIVNSHNE